MNIINRMQVLKLNRNFQAVGQSTVGKALVDLSAGKSALALDIEYEKDDAGNYILDDYGWPCGQSWANPVDWETWIDLPVRPFDDVIHYGNGTKVMRAPTVLIAKNYYKMPKKSFKGKKPSKEAVWLRDNGVDQYSGKKLSKHEATLDHVIPQSKGGPNTWENLVITSKEINSKKGNRLNEEVGLKLRKKPEVPRAVIATELIREVKHPDWKPYLPHLAPKT